MRLLVTGGAGFIGSAVVRQAIADGHEVVNLDALTYAANPANLASVEASDRYAFEEADIRDRAALDRIFARHQPDAVMHLAAESHVDRSIDGPAAFIDTNITGTYTLLEAARAYWGGGRDFRFHHISTDEVFGTLGADGRLHRGDPLRAELALLGVEGGERPPRPRLARDLRPAGRALELLEQLRPVPLPREADPGRHPERPRGQADPGLRPRRERPRLALRRGPCDRAPEGGDRGQGRRELQHRRQRRGEKHRHRHPHLRADGRDARRRRAPRPPHHLRHRPPRPRLPLRDRRLEDPPRARLGSPR